MTSKSKLLAWRNVGAIAIVFCLIFWVFFSVDPFYDNVVLNSVFGYEKRKR